MEGEGRGGKGREGEGRGGKGREGEGRGGKGREGEGGGRDREEDLEKKEGEKMAIYSSGLRGVQRAHSPHFSS